MQYPKNELRQKILEAAREEFLHKGYHKSSLRRIASLSGMTTGGIYTYFNSKASLFEAIVSNAVLKWKSHYEFFISLSGIDNYTEGSFTFERNDVPRFNHYHFLVKFVNLYREELYLIFFRSVGTLYENFQEELLNTSLEEGRKRINQILMDQRHESQPVSDFFLRNLINFNINLIREMLLKELSLDDMLSYEKEFARFFFHGWAAMLENK